MFCCPRPALLLLPLLMSTAVATTMTTLSSRALMMMTTNSTITSATTQLPPLFPLEPLDYLGLGSAVLGLMLAAGGGIGGGGLLVPIYILVLEFPVKYAIPLASVTVLGGAIANNALNARKRHPTSKLPQSVIDWDLILQLEPMTMAGALLGTDLNDLLPDWVLVVLLLLLLSVTAFKTLQKAAKMYEMESQNMLNDQETSEKKAFLNVSAAATQNSYSSSDSDAEAATTEHSKTTDYGTVESGGSSTAQAHDLHGGNKALFAAPLSFGPDNVIQVDHHAWIDAAKLTALFVVITAMNLLKGGPSEAGGGPAGLAVCGSTCFWVAEAAMLLLIVAFAAHVRSSLLHRLRQQEHDVRSEIAWNEQNTVTYPLLAIAAGLVAGLFGVGGGILKGPIMLALGVHPAVAAATSACMILFTSATATVSYAIFGLLKYDYALMCFVIGLMATMIGQTVMSVLLQRYQRNSYIAFSIGAVVALSAICMTIESVIMILGW